MPAVALYARYSSDLQNRCSIDDQLNLCREYAARQGWTVVGCYHDEAVSGVAIRGRNGAIRMLEDASARRFDVVCAEALDRISRDQEDIAHVYKRLCFERIALNTVAEGQVNEMHIGLKGTMNALFLKDLAEKTRRGQRGRIEKGRSGGGLAYGYDVVPADESGAGARVINEDQARVVRRIFRDFAEGMTPGAIADMLNSEGVRGPAGRPWGATTIRGHRVRATGILNNPLYRGELVWNRQSFVKDPVTGKRQARMNPEGEWIRRDVPELRVVDEELWRVVKNWQDETERTALKVRDGIRKAKQARASGMAAGAFPLHRLLVCAECGDDFCHVGRDRYGCAGYQRNKTCSNRGTLQKRQIEADTGGLLAEASLRLDAHAPLVRSEKAEAVTGLHGDIMRERRELEAVEGKLTGLLGAIEDGLYTQRMKIRFHQLEDRAQRLRAHLQIDSSRLRSLQEQPAAQEIEEVRKLLTEIPNHASDLAVRTLRSRLGPITVSHGSRRLPPTLRWKTPGSSRAMVVTTNTTKA